MNTNTRIKIFNGFTCIDVEKQVNEFIIETSMSTIYDIKLFNNIKKRANIENITFTAMIIYEAVSD